MKTHICQLFFLTILSSLLVCCNKQADKQMVNNKGTQLVRIQQGTDPATDTVNLISYNTQNKIEMITDSTNDVSLNASYNAQGRLSGINTTFSFNASYTYDGNGLLTEVNTDVVGVHDQYIITYNNGVIAEKKWYTQVNVSGPPSLWETFKYTVTDGNITDIKEYRYDGTLISDKELDYDLEPNPFKELSLFNFANVLGTDEIFNLDTYFNKNILHGYAVNGFNESNNNLYDNVGNSDNLITIESFVPAQNGDYTFLTWQFSYK